MKRLSAGRCQRHVASSWLRDAALVPVSLRPGLVWARCPKAIEAASPVGGTAAAPEITSSLKLSDPTIAGQPYTGATAEAQYSGKRVVLRAVLQQDPSHSLNANGTMPLLLSWQDKFRAEPLDGMDVRVQSAGVSMSFLNAFSGKAVQRITDSPLSHVVVTNTIPLTETGAACPKVRVKSVGRLLGEAIKRIHHGDSISSLFM